VRRFEREQSIVKVGKVVLGGQPGELPTVLIGSIFYDRDPTVTDGSRGLFDKKRAEQLISRQEELSEKTKNPHMVDVVASTTGAMERYLDFVSGVTDAAILVDSSSRDVRLSGARHAAEVGLTDRVVYNSIEYHVNEGETTALREIGIKHAILLAYNPQNLWPSGRPAILHERLLSAAERAGISSVLVDTAVLDVPSIGLAAEAVETVKRELGLPTGCAPLNAVLEWKKVKALGPKAKDACSASAAAVIQMSGGDFILYGPITKSEIVFPACAMVDSVIAYEARLHGIKPRSNEHPLYTIFKG